MKWLLIVAAFYNGDGYLNISGQHPMPDFETCTAVVDNARFEFGVPESSNRKLQGGLVIMYCIVDPDFESTSE